MGTTFKISGDEDQKKFIMLRQKYVREKSILTNIIKSGAGATSRPKRHLMEMLSLLDDCIEHRKTSSNFILPSSKPSCSNVELCVEDNLEIQIFNDEYQKTSMVLDFNSEIDESLLNFSKKRYSPPSVRPTPPSEPEPQAQPAEPLVVRHPELSIRPPEKRRKKNNEVEPKIKNILDKLSSSIENKEENIVSNIDI